MWHGSLQMGPFHFFLTTSFLITIPPHELVDVSKLANRDDFSRQWRSRWAIRTGLLHGKSEKKFREGSRGCNAAKRSGRARRNQRWSTEYIHDHLRISPKFLAINLNNFLKTDVARRGNRRSNNDNNSNQIRSLHSVKKFVIQQCHFAFLYKFVAFDCKNRHFDSSHIHSTVVNDYFLWCLI